MSTWIEHDLTATRPPVRGGHACGALEAIVDPSTLSGDSKVIKQEEDASATVEVASEKKESGADDEKPAPVVVMFGGADPFGITYNDVYAFKVGATSAPVTHIQANGASDGPKSRSGHSMVRIPPTKKKPEVDGESGAVEKKSEDLFVEFAIFGGNTFIPEPAQYNDLWILGVHRGCCDLPAVDKKGRPLNKLLHWSQPPTTGPAPTARNDHASEVVGNNMLVIGGSSASTGGPLGDGYMLNLATWTWQTLKLPGDFIPREMASCTALPVNVASPGTSKVLVYGGRGAVNGQPDIVADGWLIEVDSSSQDSTGDIAETTANKVPTNFPQRCCHTASFDAATSSIIIAGGFSTGDLHNDVNVSFTKSGDELVFEAVKEVIGRKRCTAKNPDNTSALMLGFGHSSVQIGDRLFVLGGIQVNDIGSSLELFERKN